VTREWTPEEVRCLGVTVDLVTAGSVLGLGRSTTYELARRGEFPVPVLKVGHRYRVVSQHLKQLLLSATPEAPGSTDANANVHDLRRTG
jgi:hypothetical protein